MLGKSLLKVLFFLLMVFANSVVVFAKEYKGTSEYYIADISTKNIAIDIARDMAMKSALEQAGTFVSSLSESSKGILTKDDIKTITLGFAKLKPGSEIINFSNPRENGVVVLSYSAVFNIDEKEVSETLKRVKQDNLELELLKHQNLIKQRTIQVLESKYKGLQEKFVTLNTEQERNEYKREIANVQSNLNVYDCYKTAVDYSIHKNYPEALVYIDKALEGLNELIKIRREPWMSEFLARILFQKGDIYSNLNELEQAEPLLKASTQLDPYYVNPYIGLAFLYTKKGNEVEAVSASTSAVTLKPCEFTYFIRMSVNFSFNRYKEAITDYLKLQNPLPKAAVAGWCYFNLKDYKNAISAFDKALQYNTTDAFSYRGKGLSYARLGNDRESIKNYTQAISIKPDFYPAYAERAAVYLHLNENQLAYNDAIYAIAHDPNSKVAIWVIEELKKRLQ